MSLLNRLGLQELIACDTADGVDKTVRLAADLHRSSNCAPGCARMLESGLYGARAMHLDSAEYAALFRPTGYRGLWRR